MASPQVDKFTRISNELFDNYILIARFLSPYENAIWLCVLRKTYGFNKVKDWISLSQIGKSTGILHSHVARAMSRLRNKMMICSYGEKGKTFSVSIQKDYEKWLLPKQVLLPEQVLPKQVTTTTHTGNQLLPKQVVELLPKQVDTKDIDKDTTTKDTITKDKYPHLSNPKFVEVFTAYLQTRKTKATDHAKKLILTDLQREEVSRAILMLEQSIKNGWTGIFQPKEDRNGRRGVNIGQDSSQYSGVEDEIKA